MQSHRSLTESGNTEQRPAACKAFPRVTQDKVYRVSFIFGSEASDTMYSKELDYVTGQYLLQSHEGSQFTVTQEIKTTLT
ncbi:hypothetical protein NDU88_005083 [Pleurodeles waltl]|uniref:Uncharacterized protein n=1 Tax=Pleurodeles waltl TaxID=8319 RepID=A0AAV7VM92_PLEWA|nr:hypothetical protein NDU88_005083 [Pleurodeles waltl]